MKIKKKKRLPCLPPPKKTYKKPIKELPQKIKGRTQGFPSSCTF